MSKDFERDDIFTGNDAISGLKISPWEGLGKPVDTPPGQFKFDGRYHDLQYWFSGSIYFASI